MHLTKSNSKQQSSCKSRGQKRPITSEMIVAILDADQDCALVKKNSGQKLEINRRGFNDLQADENPIRIGTGGHRN